MAKDKKGDSGLLDSLIGGGEPGEPKKAAPAPSREPAADPEPGFDEGSEVHHTGEEELAGILLNKRASVSADDVEVDEPLMKEGGGKMGLIVLGVAVLAIVGGLAFVFSNEQRAEEVKAFFSGEIQDYKEQSKKAEEAAFRDKQAATRNQYGSITLEYFPKDARVNLTELKWTETIDSYYDRVKKGGTDTRGEPSRREIDNQTHKLKEREVVESLPLKDLPIQQKSEDESQMETYAYEVSIEREGYYPRKFMFLSDDTPMQPAEDVQALKWENIGPGMWAIGWSGADLQPKPEMMKDKYILASIAIDCLKKSPEGQKADADQLDFEQTRIRRDNGFATDVQWNDVDVALRANATLWPEIEKAIAEGKCE
jgi:hypothetical protein